MAEIVQTLAIAFLTVATIFNSVAIAKNSQSITTVADTVYEFFKR